jgi:hypothetical protein
MRSQGASLKLQVVYVEQEISSLMFYQSKSSRTYE